MKVKEIARDYPITLTASVNSILAIFATAFNSPTVAVFTTLFTGAVMVRGRHTVTRMIVAAGNRVSHHSRFHRFFSRADWQMRELWKRLTVAVVNNLVAAGAVIWLAIDETACRKTGSKIYNAGMVFDNRPKPRKGDDLVWGLTWVVASIIVQVPLWPGRGFAIPISMRLYRNEKRCKLEGRRLRTKPELALEMIQEISLWLPGRKVLLHVDGGYASNKLMKPMPDTVQTVGRLRWDAALYQLPPKRSGRRGRPARKGHRLPNPAEYVSRRPACWRPVQVRGKRFEAQSWVALWPAVFGARPILIVASRRPARPGHSQPGQPQFFYCTDLSMTPADVLVAYDRRWSIEMLFHEIKERLGFEDPQSRTMQAVERTAPFLVFVAGVVQYWFLIQRDAALVGWRPRWRRKANQSVSFSDMLAALRRALLDGQFSQGSTSDTEIAENLKAFIVSAAYAA